MGTESQTGWYNYIAGKQGSQDGNPGSPVIRAHILNHEALGESETGLPILKKTEQR